VSDRTEALKLTATEPYLLSGSKLSDKNRHRTNDFINHLATQLLKAEARQCYLPKITEEIYEQFVGTDFIVAGEIPQWTQDAVDFGCLLNSTLEPAQ
jgi:hypothetical protein